MHQNQSLKRIYRDLLEGNPTRPQNKIDQAAFNHCLCLQWEDGRKMLFYYAYLLTVELVLQEDHNLIILRFTTQKVTLKGWGLDFLFEQFAHEKPAVIQVFNTRYIVTKMKSDYLVFEAIVDTSK